MDKVSVTFGERTVFWQLESWQAAQLLQMLVQSLGPAESEARND